MVYFGIIHCGRVLCYRAGKPRPYMVVYWESVFRFPFFYIIATSSTSKINVEYAGMGPLSRVP